MHAAYIQMTTDKWTTFGPAFFKVNMFWHVFVNLVSANFTSSRMLPAPVKVEPRFRIASWRAAVARIRGVILAGHDECVRACCSFEVALLGHGRPPVF